MRHLSVLGAALLLWSVALSAQTTIYWKKDHIFGTPRGGRIATAVPEPDDTTAPSTPTNLAYGTVTPTTVALSWSASTDSGGGDVTHIASEAESCFSGGTCSEGVDTAPTTGSTILWTAFWTDETATLSSFSQTAGTGTLGTCTILENQLTVDGTRAAAIGHCPVTTGGTMTLTATNSSASGEMRFGWSEYSGVASIGDWTFEEILNASGTDAVASSTLTVSADSVLWGVCTKNNGTENTTAGTGFTQRWDDATDYIFLEDMDVSSDDNVTCTGDVSYVDFAVGGIVLEGGGSGSGLAGYKVYRGPVPVGTTTSTSFTDEGLVAGTEYSYTVRAFDYDQNHSSASSAVTPTTGSASGDTTDPSIPDGLAAISPDDDTVELTWNASVDEGGSGIDGYKVYRDSSLVSGGTPITTTSFTDTGLDPHTEYTYNVRAVDNQSNESADSDDLDATTRGTVDTNDDFNRADSSPGLGAIGTYGWSVNGFDLVSNAAHAIPYTSGTGWRWATRYTGGSHDIFDDFNAEVDLLGGPYGQGFIFWQDTNGQYRAYVDGSTVELQFYYSGTETVLASTALSVSAPLRLRLETDSASRRILVFVNGDLEIDFTDTDTSRPNSGRMGMTGKVSDAVPADAAFDNFLLEVW